MSAADLRQRGLDGAARVQTGDVARRSRASCGGCRSRRAPAGRSGPTAARVRASARCAGSRSAPSRRSAAVRTRCVTRGGCRSGRWRAGRAPTGRRRPACRARRTGGRRARAGSSRPSGRPSAGRSSESAISGVAMLYGRFETKAVGAGSSDAGSTPSASSKRSVTLARPASVVASAGSRRRSSSMAWTCADGVGERRREDAEPRPHLEHDVVGRAGRRGGGRRGRGCRRPGSAARAACRA